MDFHGTTYDPQQDQARLETALGKVYTLMSDGQYRTLREIADHCGISEAGASARLRDLRKHQFQEWFPTAAVNSTRLAGGLWQYQVVVGKAKSAYVAEGYLFDVSKDAQRA